MWKVFACGVLAVISFGVAGFGLGVTVTNNELPKCQEDEYLYPQDYHRGGKVYASELRCVHIDKIREGN